MGGERLMRVVYVSQFPNMVGGGEHSLLDLMCNLPQIIEPILITPSSGLFSDKAGKAKVKHESLPMPPLAKAKFSVFSLWRKKLKALNPDVIHANNSRAAFFAGVAAKSLGIPVVFHCRISDNDGLMDKILMRLVHVTVCNSQAVAKRFEDFNKPTHVIYNGLNTAQQKQMVNPLPSVDKYMLFVGRMTEEKQVEQALAVFAHLAKQDVQLNFVLIGGAGPEDEGYFQKVKSWSAKQPWSGRVHWLGYTEQVNKWYAYAQLLILTSAHEGFGRVLVEAMAQATPVVAYAVGGVPEVFEDTVEGRLIAPNNTQAMIEACSDILQHQEVGERMGKAGLTRAQYFSIEKHVSDVVEVYKEVVNHA